MAADSPCWTFVQSKYPQMVEQRPGVRRATCTGRCGAWRWSVAVAMVVGATILAYGFFHVPAVAPLMAILSAALLWRYKNYLFGQALRAVGRVDAVTGLGGAKLVAALILITAGDLGRRRLGRDRRARVLLSPVRARLRVGLSPIASQPLRRWHG